MQDESKEREAREARKAEEIRAEVLGKHERARAHVATGGCPGPPGVAAESHALRRRPGTRLARSRLQERRLSLQMVATGAALG